MPANSVIAHLPDVVLAGRGREPAVLDLLDHSTSVAHARDDASGVDGVSPTCTTSRSGRSLYISEHDRYLVAARAQAATAEFQQTYRRWRPMVERSIAWLMRDGHRCCLYRGIARNQLGFGLRVAAVNLSRLLTLGLGYDGGWKIA